MSLYIPKNSPVQQKSDLESIHETSNYSVIIIKPVTYGPNTKPFCIGAFTLLRPGAAIALHNAKLLHSALNSTHL